MAPYTCGDIMRKRHLRGPIAKVGLKRWPAGTYQGPVSHQHLNYYLDEFTFRFNRRSADHRGLLFFRLLQNAM